MKINTKVKTISLLIALMLFVVACGGGDDSAETATEPAAPAAESQEAAPTNTSEPEPTNTAEPEPTNTPEPEPTSTALPEPTNTPEPEPTPTEEPAASAAKLLGDDALRFDDEVLGLSFSYPADWFAQTIFGTLVFVTSSDIDDDSSNSDETIGLVIVITPNDEEMTPEEMIDSAFGEIDFDEDEITIVDGPSEVEVDGQAGVSILFEGEDGEDMLTGRVTAVPTDDAVFVFMAVMPQAVASDETADILNAIVQTAELGTPDFDLAMGDLDFDFDDALSTEAIYAQGELGSVVRIDSAETNAFTYTLAADTGYVFFSQPSADADIVLKLLDADGELIQEVDDRGSDGGETMFIDIATDGDYQLIVEEFFGGQLVASVIAVSDAEMQSAELSDAAPEFELVVDASSAAQLLIVMPTDELDLVISDGLGLYIDNTGLNKPEQVYLAAGSEYTLLISDFSTDFGAFSYLVIEVDESFEPVTRDDAFVVDSFDTSSALPIDLDTIQTAQSVEPLLYQLTLEAGVDYLAVAKPTDDGDIVLSLFSSDGELLDSVDADFDGDPEAILFTASVGGIYFVKVGGFISEINAILTVLQVEDASSSAEFDGTAGQEFAITVAANANPVAFVARPDAELDVVLSDDNGNSKDGDISGDQEFVLLPASPEADQTVVISLYSVDTGPVSYFSVALPEVFAPSE